MSNPTDPVDRIVEELPAGVAELLERARAQRRELGAPDDLRRRVLARAVAELSAPNIPVAQATALVQVERPSARFGLRLLAAAALIGGFVLGLPPLVRRAREVVLGPEPQSSGNWQVAGSAAELLHPQSPFLQLPLLPLPDAEPSSVGRQLFRDQPFASGSRGPGPSTWQVRRWNDPKAAPAEAAAYDFDDGVMCVTLAAGERVLAGWPWPSADARAPDPVRLERGGAYRLAFEAWVQGPRPSQVLVGVGHTELPFEAAAGARVQVSSRRERFGMDFIAARDDDSVGVAILATNPFDADPTRLCLGNMILSQR